MARSSSKIKIEYVPIEKLKPSDYNPRFMPQLEMRNLMQSIKEFGNVDPVVANKDFTIIGGEQRWRACKNLGHKTMPVVFIDVDKDKEPELNVALNKIHGRWDREKLANLFFGDHRKLRIKRPDLTGFDSSELSKLHIEIQKKQAPPEIVFFQELGEEHNFVILFFEKDVDWKQFESLYELPKVHDIRSKVGFEKKGIGRVIPGPEFFEKILGKQWRKPKRS